MGEQRTIGQILINLGRITEEDVARTLEYQRNNGGYFGEALLGLGIVSQEELEWSLASQFDLPYVFPDADSIDPEAASLVSPEWALAHLTLPIMKTAHTLTVVVDSPLKTEAVDVLEARTDLTIELALASTSTIRDLIRQVYARGAAAEESDQHPPTSLAEFLSLATDAASNSFGVSTRGLRAWAWFEDSGRIRRRPLDGAWESQLEQLLTPPPSEVMEKGEQRAQWTGHLNREGMITPVGVQFLSSPVGSEYLFRPGKEEERLQERFPLPSQGILSEVRLLARSGTARFTVVCEPAALGGEILPFLPALLFDPSWRSVYVADDTSAVSGEVFSLDIPQDAEARSTELSGLRPFRFDVVVADLSGDPAEWATQVIDVASVAFIRWKQEDERKVAMDAGAGWELRIEKSDSDQLEWTLEPLN